MAISTCDANVEVPKGMQRFEVIRTTIKDSLGQYCEPGDMAVLDKKTAKVYLDQNHIRVALPDFEEPDDDGKSGDTDGDGGAKGGGGEAAADTGKRRT